MQQDNDLDVLSKSTSVVGNITSTGEFRIAGRLDGDGSFEHLVICYGARVSGTLKGNLIEIFGDFEGTIAAERVAAFKGCHVNGEVTYKSLSVEDGSIIVGKLFRGEG